MNSSVNSAPASHIYFSQRLRLHYIDWGNEDAPGMLLVHGIHDHCRTWDNVARDFGGDYHVLAPDLRGHGDSQWLQGSSYQYLDYVYDLHQLVQQAGLGPVTLVGHSMGGAIAALFAGIFPELVKRLIVIEGIGMWRAMQPQQPIHEQIRDWVVATRALSARLPRRYGSLSEAFQRMQQANPQLSEAQAMHLTVHGANQNEDGSYSWKYDNYTHNFNSAGLSTDETVALWGRITCPVLLVNAENGLEHRIGQDGTLSYFSNATLQEIAGAGHWTYHDKHQEVVSHIRSFAKSNLAGQ